jgi:hypothetical protein
MKISCPALTLHLPHVQAILYIMPSLMTLPKRRMCKVGAYIHFSRGDVLYGL